MFIIDVFGTADIREIRHFQTVGHVAGKADVEDGRANTFIFDNIDHAGNQRSRLPSESRAWFEDNLQVRISFVETLHDAH